MREIRTGQFYRHFKGGLYQIVGIAEHTETGEKLVIYQALYGDYRIYARPYEMFAGETDHEKYPEVTQKYRFELTVPGKEITEEPEKKEPEKKAAVEEAHREEEIAKEEVPVEQTEEQPEDGGVNPILLEFLDADSLEEKLHILTRYQKQMDEGLLNSIAISLDLVVEKKNLQEKYDEIMNCLSMMKHFECNRLR